MSIAIVVVFAVGLVVAAIVAGVVVACVVVASVVVSRPAWYSYGGRVSMVPAST